MARIFGIAKMSECRSVMAVLMLLVTCVLVLIHGKDVTTLEYDDLLPVTETNARQYVDTDASIKDQRQPRVSLHTEVPASKAEREQVLRSILAAKRRQILNQRSSETFRSSTVRSARPANTTIDSIDVLEAQETRHASYVTLPSNTKVQKETFKEDKFESSTKANEQNTEHSESDTKTIDESSTIATSTNDTKQINTSASSPFPPSASSLSKAETDNRKKNTVSMPESLYNHFRPVESNVPVEDMSQFLYFGQKLHREIHNATGNNSVEATSAAPTMPSSRRRYSMKRFGVTMATPVPKLEEIINEEMNIAVERQTVEKNKVSKIKNIFRSPGNNLYYRKARPTDSTIALNVILSKDTRNITETRSETSDDKFRGYNPSAHAGQDQLQRSSERGSAAHVLDETRNATESTQIPYDQPVSANTYDEKEQEESTVKSEIYDRPLKSPNDANLANGIGTTKISRRNKRVDNSTTVYSPPDNITENQSFRNHESKQPAKQDAEKAPADYSVEKPSKTKSYEEIPFSKETEAIDRENSRSSISRESNNIETSTSREKFPRSSTETFPITWSTPSSQSSTLRIVVTEKNPTLAIGNDAGEKNTVKPVDSEERVRVVASGDVPTPKSPIATSSATNPRTVLAHQQHQHQQQQQHVYAYTITNVTRLLRNYTGPGLSREEQGDPQRSTGTGEITTGSPQRRQPLPPPSPPSPPSLLLPRAGSSIEAAQTPAELSASTTVEPAVAGGASSGIAVGDRQRKVVAVAPQSQQQRALNRTIGTSSHTIKDRPIRPSEVSRGTLRWNHSKPRNPEDGTNDRSRFLRKSASAVLNQRIGGTGADEEPPSTSKRRRVSTSQSTAYLAGNGRRIKGQGLIKSAPEKADFNRSSTFGSSERNLVGDKRTEDETQGRAVEAMHLGRVNQELEFPENRSALDSEMESTNGTSVVSSTVKPMVLGGITIEKGKDDGEDKNVVAEASTLKSEDNVEFDAKEQNGEAQSESSKNGAAGDVESSVVASANDEADNRDGSSTVTVTETLDETIAPKEMVTTVPTPVFPVTPKIFTEASKTPAGRETFTLRPTESVNEATEIKPAEPNRPFGIAADLDPSEIQRMYRSNGTTSTTESPTIPTTMDIQDTVQNTVRSQDTNVSTGSTESTDSTENRTRSGERSPEVRGRNLSDKSREKDDVLPIMHLYNTSNIFSNGSADSFSRRTQRPRVSRPMEEGEKKEGKEDVDTTVKTNEEDVTTTRDPLVNNETVNSSRLPLPEVKEPPATKKDKQEDGNREYSQDSTTTVKGFVNGNRTRHRPSYHHTVPPEYNSSGYPVDLNRTFFETGLISVSSRESVNISEVILRRHDGDAIASQETVAVVSYILATLVVFPIAVGVGLILRRLIIRNRKVLEESDTSSEISCRKDALNLENGDFKTSIEKAITKLPRIQHLCHEAEKPPPPPSQESRWEFPRDKLRLQTVLGQGNFGQVWKAEADDLTGHQGTTRLVAVKTVKEGASEREKEDLVRELEIMQQLGSHPNVVTLLGCCTEEEPHYLILEYVMYGKLLAYLRDHRTRQDFYNFSEDSAALTSRDLTVFGYCVARGMEYLASKKIIHRDLAARNVLVDHNKLCKIADFGMSRFANEDGEVIETRHGRNALPIRWMAPESLIYSLFTTKTDVWSFGILMWEIVTLGSTPYPDMTAREVMRNVQNGYRLERPSHCRSELFRVISRCWHADPDRRPEFQTLRRDLAQLLEDNMNGHYVDLESFASECTD